MRNKSYYEHKSTLSSLTPLLILITIDDDAAHPLLNCSVKVCITVGKKKSWFPAAVTRYKIAKNKTSSGLHNLLLSYEDEDEKWHILDSPHDKVYTDADLLEPGYEGSLGTF